MGHLCLLQFRRRASVFVASCCDQVVGGCSVSVRGALARCFTAAHGSLTWASLPPAAKGGAGPPPLEPRLLSSTSSVLHIFRLVGAVLFSTAEVASRRGRKMAASCSSRLQRSRRC